MDRMTIIQKIDELRVLLNKQKTVWVDLHTAKAVDVALSRCDEIVDCLWDMGPP